MSHKSTRSRGDALIPFFILTFTITWGIGIFAILLPAKFQVLFGEISDTHPLYYIAVAAPTISATILAVGREGWSGLSALYARLVRWRFGIQWYVLVLVGLPILGWLVSRITGSSPLKDASTPALPALLLSMLISGPLGEELGWRGFALPRLLKRFNPFVASLVLGIIWGVWHLPSFFLSAMVQARLSLPLFLLNALFLSFLVSWIFLHTGGSVLITVLIHYMVNFWASVLGVQLPVITSIMLVTAVLVVALDKRIGWLKRAHP